MRILGLSSETHDAGVAMLDNGKISFVLEEERLNREKHTRKFPFQSLRAAFDDGGRTLADVDVITVPLEPHRLRRTYLSILLRNLPGSLALLHPRANTMTDSGVVFLNTWLNQDLRTAFDAQALPPIVNVGHHDSHAAIFFASPFEEASILVMDGYGEDAASSTYTGAGNRVTRHWHGGFFDSLGMIYTLVTLHLGFQTFEEGTVMALAACGGDRYVERMRDIVRLEEGGRFRVNMADYFNHDTAGMLRPFKRKFIETFGPARKPGAPLEDRHRDLARALQTVVEEVIIHVARGMEKTNPSRNLVMTGGVALNCVANARLLRDTSFERVWVPPCASDTGGPLGSTLYHWHHTLGRPRSFEMKHAFYGLEYADAQIRRALDESGLAYDWLDEAELLNRVAHDLAADKIVGWYQGRYEIGPRALGNRSILASPLKLEIKDIINRRIKYREPFRPFAPAVLAEYAHEYFEIDQPDPFMTMAPRVRPDMVDKIPAAVHVDGTARIQTIERSVNPRYYGVIENFMRITGVPVVLNTSFNKQEPIVTRPQEAISCFLRTDMDVLVLGNYYSTDRRPQSVARARAAFRVVEANTRGGE